MKESWINMVATFILFLREGLEASLVVSMLFAVLRQLGQLRYMRAVWIGIALAVFASLVGGLAIYFSAKEFEGAAEQLFEGLMFLLAVILLTTVTFWMQKHSRTMKQEIMEKASSATSGFAFGLLAFTSVGREGLETALFTVALTLQSSGLLTMLGAILGLVAAIALCYLMYRIGYRLNYRVFFRVMGIILIFFAAGLLSNSLGEFHELGWLPFGEQIAWNVSHVLSQETDLGQLLHGLIGYADAPNLLQVGAYLAFLCIVGGTFLWITRPAPPKRAKTQKIGTTAQSVQ